MRTGSTRISLPDLLDPSMDPRLSRALGRSLMVEGGASVLSSFLSATVPAPSATPTDERVPLVDLVIVTVAPTLIGREGVAIPWLAAVRSSPSALSLFLSIERFCQRALHALNEELALIRMRACSSHEKAGLDPSPRTDPDRSRRERHGFLLQARVALNRAVGVMGRLSRLET